MALGAYRMTVPVLTRALRVLSDLLDRGEAHALATGRDPDELVNARLAPDMFPLSGQIQRASDAAKGAAARLTGGEPPAFADDETTFADLRARVDRTVAYLESLDPAAFEGAQEREIHLKFKAFEARMSGEDFIASFMVPNFFFHVATAYGILRHEGVPIGKADFLGRFES